MCDCEKNWHVGFLDEALEDVDDLAAYYAQEGDGERSALKFRESFEQVVDAISSFPRIPPMWDETDTVRRVDFPAHKVALVYRIIDDTFEVIAVAAFHTLSDPIKYEALVAERIAQ